MDDDPVRERVVTSWRRAVRALLTLLLVAWSAAAGAVDLAQARRLVDERAYVPALAVFDLLLRQQPGNADLLIEAARVAGFADRNAEAADRYRQALLAAPARRMDILPSLAWQSLWAGRYQDAAGFFDELLQRSYEPARSAQGLREARLGRARELVALRDYAAALTWYDALVAAEPGDPDLAIERARVIGYADRNSEAAQAYGDIAARFPGRRHDVLSAWAWQRLWSKDAAGALSQFEELLATGPASTDALRGRAESCAALGQNDCALEAWERLLALDPASVDARLGSARALMWLGRNDEALLRFDEVLARDPTLRDARIGRAYVLNFSGRSLDASREFTGLLPSDDEGLKLQAARACYWAGMPERALPLLEDSSLPEARWLRDFRVRRESRPYVSLGFDWSDDSDELTVGTASASAGWRLPANGTAELSLRSVSIEGRDTASGPGAPAAPPDTRYSARGNQAMLTWAGRLGDERSPNGIVWPMIAVGARDYEDWTSFAWRARARYVPVDQLAFSLDAGNGVIETIGALRNHVTYTEANLAAEVRPNDRWRVSGGYGHLHFNDGNDRDRVTGTVEYLALPARRMRVGLDGIHFADSEPNGPGRGDLGYWNPEKYSELRLFSSISGEQGPLSYDARASAGYYRELDGYGNRSSGPTAMVEGVAAYDVAERLQLRLYGGASWSGMGIGSGGTGYHRTYVGVSLTGYF